MKLRYCFSGDHYYCLLKKESSDEEQKNIVEVEFEKWNDQAKANVRSLKRDCCIQNDYAIKYSDNFLQSIIKYLSNGTFPQSIEDIRSEKYKIISNPNSTKADKAKIKAKISNAKDNSDSWYQQKEDIRLLSILSLEVSIPL